MKRNLLSTVTLTVTLGCLMANSVQAANLSAHRWCPGDLTWLPDLVQQWIC